MFDGRRLRHSLLAAVVATIALSTARAAIDEVVRNEADLGPIASRTTSARVSGVRVVLADYELIARDFPEQARRLGESESAWKARVNEWLVRETGFIAVEQTRQTVVNSPIPTTRETKIGIRPQDYNRAHVLEVDGGLMDAKGTGTINPFQGSHANGLATLGETIREFVFEKAVDMIFRHARADARTVGCYAVLDYGFDVVHADGSASRAGYVLRQAHRRAPGLNSQLSVDKTIPIERLLRRYGVTTSGDSQRMMRETINMQGTSNTRVTEVIDFGAYLVAERFSKPVANAMSLRVLFSPDSPDFVQPDPNVRLPLSHWGNFGTPDPKDDKPWRWSHELASAFAEGRATQADAETHLSNLLTPIRRTLGHVPSRCELAFH